MEELMMTVVVFVVLCLVKQEQEQEVSNEVISPTGEDTTNMDQPVINICINTVDDDDIDEACTESIEEVKVEVEVEKRKDISELKIREARKLASCYGIPQKEKGKDKPLSQLREDILSYLLSYEQNLVSLHFTQV